MKLNEKEMHSKLWTLVGELEAGKADKKETKISLPLPAHRATITVSLVEAVQAILNHLDLHLKRTPEIIAVKKKK